MADLHEALKRLAPTEWGDVPLDNLSPYMIECFEAGEQLCNFVPPPPSLPPESEALRSSNVGHHKRASVTQSAPEVHPSPVRPLPAHAPDEALQQSWGKPLKVSQKNNSQNVAVYKMAAHDRHGAWFARRSVHEGLGFARFKAAMQNEFPHSLKVHGANGAPGAGAVRGLAGDRLVEQIDVDGAGRLQVYELSCAFPGPVTPRDFLTLVLTTDIAPADRNATRLHDDARPTPRQYMIVSKPVRHPDAPERSGFVRGQYESVELIREIPLHRAQTESMPNLPSSHASNDHRGRVREATTRSEELGGSEATGDEQHGPHPPRRASSAAGYGGPPAHDDPELNPVEWIMITRSEPGGGIPRFLVERGTPEAVLDDVTKFLKWACRFEEGSVPDDDEAAQHETPSEQQTSSEKQTPSEQHADQKRRDSVQVTGLANGRPDTGAKEVKQDGSASLHNAQAAPGSQPDQQQGGIMSSVAHALEVGLAAYAPLTISEHLHNYLHPEADLQGGHLDADSGTSSDTSSLHSFMSADEMRHTSTKPEHERQVESSDVLSVTSGLSSGEPALASVDKKHLTSHEKEVLKLIQEREKLDRRLAKKRADEEERLKRSAEKEESEQDKARAKYESEMRKAEASHRKVMEKLERKKEKQARKAEQKRRKREEQNRLSLVSRERDEFRTQLDSYRRENGLLVARIEELQQENTAMAIRLGKVGGPEAVKDVRDETDAGRKRTVSMKSDASKRSLESKASAKS